MIKIDTAILCDELLLQFTSVLQETGLRSSAIVSCQKQLTETLLNNILSVEHVNIKTHFKLDNVSG